jgi:hypothetical protein
MVTSFLQAKAEDTLEVHHVSNMKAHSPINRKLHLDKVSPCSLTSPGPFLLLLHISIHAINANILWIGTLPRNNEW